MENLDFPNPFKKGELLHLKRTLPSGIADGWIYKTTLLLLIVDIYMRL